MVVGLVNGQQTARARRAQGESGTQPNRRLSPHPTPTVIAQSGRQREPAIRIGLAERRAGTSVGYPAGARRGN